MTDYAENPTPRIVAAESRRRMRAVIEDSSLGTAGAQALRKRGSGLALLCCCTRRATLSEASTPTTRETRRRAASSRWRPRTRRSGRGAVSLVTRGDVPEQWADLSEWRRQSLAEIGEVLGT